MQKSLITAGAILVLAACGKSDSDLVLKSKYGGPKKDIVVSSDKGVTTVKLPDGSARMETGSKVQLPTGIETYPGGRIDTAMSGRSGAGNSSAISIVTKDTPAQVAAFYKDNLSKKGYVVGSDSTTDGTTMITLQRANDGSSALIMISRTPTQTSAAITISGK